MIILVLSMHACDTYSPFGNWYYVDRQPTGLGTKLFFGVYQSFLQAFFMAALFFIAGYFSAAAYDRKGFVGAMTFGYSRRIFRSRGVSRMWL